MYSRRSRVSVDKRRKDGESGVRSVQCLEKQDCWNFIESNGWVKRLFEEAIMHSKTRKPGAPKDLVEEPAVFVLEYNDASTRAAAFLMTGLVEDFTVAVDVEGQSKPVSTLMYLQERRPHHHFGCLVKNIEMMFETGKAPSSGRADHVDQRHPRLRARIAHSGLQETRHG